MSDKRLGVVLFGWLVLVPACFFIEASENQPGPMGGAGGDPGGVPPGLGIGAVCTTADQCRRGLTCAAANTCTPRGDLGPGAACVVSAECLVDLYCGLSLTPQGVPQTACAPRVAQPGAVGAVCTSEGDCASGMACMRDGLSGACQTAGSGDVGALCSAASDCYGGLLCLGGVCSSQLAYKAWPGATCEVAEEAVAKIKFQIPRAADPPSDDFFALPFPNDARLKNGKLDMKNFPRPGVGLLGLDSVDRYIKAIEADVNGASARPTVFMRFSRSPQIAQLESEGTVRVVNLTPGSPAYGLEVSQVWRFSSGGAGTGTGSRYICPRYLALRISGQLDAGGTYAVVVKGPLADGTNQAFVQDSDFAAMLGVTAPADPELAAAWTSHAPLRTWVADPRSELTPATVLGGTVFTVQKTEDPIKGLRTAVQTAPAPNLAVKTLVKCGEAASPCDDGVTTAEKQRGCLAPPVGAAFDEYQGLVTLPVFQKGTKPYEGPEQGGVIEYEPTTGAAVIQATEDVCFSLTVPKGSMPAAGWPVVVYAHGTGGSYLSGRTTWAQDFAAGVAVGGDPVPVAMISYDGALHASRKGVSTRNVDELVFNFLNPVSARDTTLQGAADLFAMAKVTEAYAQAGVKFDPAKLYLYGHSQGANAAAVAAGFDPRYKTVVLSGAGGYLSLSLATKQKPVDIKGALPLLLSDQITYASPDPILWPEYNPLISVLQMYFDRSDPVNFVQRIVRAPLMDVGAKHLLHIYGQNDTYSPDPTQQELGLAAGVASVGPPLVPHADLPITPAPATANLGGFTAVQVQLAPVAYDGHFVSTQNPKGREAVLQMFVTAARSTVPTITP